MKCRGDLSLRLDIRCSDHLAPLLGFLGLLDTQCRLIRTRETSHADVTLGNEGVQLFMRSRFGSRHVIVGEFDQMTFCFRIGRCSCEIE
jgi:hypothetical protein